mgnify:FL=1|tara:strand:+ start:374 stop:796 length:423 start_codon:yes stop_codon:yes gene_type:complete
MEQYEVGQILYMTSSKSFKIIPIQVVEEVVRTTINGKEETYMICFPDKEKTVTDIKKIKTEIFKTVDEVENHLINNTKKAIKQLIQEADIIKNEAFGTTKKIKSDIVDQLVQQDENDDIIKVDLGNGQIGKISKKQIPIL